MDSFRNIEEEVNLNTHVPAPHLNIFKYPTSLEEAWKPVAVISASSDNYVSEYNNEIVIETEVSDDVSVKPSSPSGT